MEKQYKQLMANAMKKIGELQARLDAAHRDRNEPIAIVGMGCRFPGGANSAQGFWQTLCAGTDTLREVPKDRWDPVRFYQDGQANKGKTYCRHAGFIDGVFDFDPAFFGISPREALMMDPQHRLLLEVSWQTLEDAGYPAQDLKGSKTGIFVGTMGYDFLQAMHDPDIMDLHSATGIALSAAAGRLAHFFDFNGPALMLDTACSSSLVAVHLACASLRAGESNFALAGGVNVMTSPLMNIAESAANMLSPDGTCKTFDARANGYGRGEGCGFVLLKRLSDALADKDQIHAVIRGSAVNHDGHSSALTVPNMHAQCAVMRSALENANLNADDIDYIEAHGTGTPLGDPIEIQGIHTVYGQNRSKDKPLYVGALKSNIGHLEGAAGIAGLIKTALCLKHARLNANRHFHTPNPHIDWVDLPIEITGTSRNWPKWSERKIGAVSSFGFSGTNAHIILEEAPKIDISDSRQAPFVLTLSGKTEQALEDSINNLHRYICETQDIDLADLCFSTTVCRDHFDHRFACVINNLAELEDRLISPAAQDAASDKNDARSKQAYALCADYLDGKKVDWLTFYTKDSYQKIPSPGYPFQRKTYRLETELNRPANQQNHPLLGHATSTPPLSWHQDNLLAGNEWLLDHKVAQQSLLPGVTYLDMALAGFGQLEQTTSAHIKHLNVLQPLRLHKDSIAPLHTTFVKEGDGYRFSITSNSVTLAEGLIKKADAPIDEQNFCVDDYTADSAIEGQAFYTDWAKRGNEWNGSFQGIQRFWREDSKRIAHVKTDNDTKPVALLDACGQLLADFADEHGLKGCFVAQKLEDIRVYAPLSGNVFYSVLTLNSTDTQTPRQLCGRIKINNPQGDLLVEVTACTFTFLENPFAENLKQSLFSLEWQNVEIKEQTDTQENTWLILPDNAGYGAAFYDYLQSIHEDAYLIKADDIKDFTTPHIVDFRMCDLSVWDGSTEQSYAARLGAVTDLINITKNTNVKLWLLTTNAWDHTPQQAPLWGLARTLAAEHSGLLGGVIDFDGANNTSALLYQVMTCQSGYKELRLKDGIIQRPALVPSTAHSQAFSCSDQASYIITGGLGGLGLAYAKLLADKGAGTLILIGRSPFPERKDWDDIASNSKQGQQIAAIRELEKQGSKVVVLSLDITDSAAFEKWLKDWPLPIRGVVHGAGVATRKPLCEATSNDFTTQLGPKMSGAIILDRALKDEKLDFFLCLSSASALLSSPDLGAYSAANAFLGAFMSYRRQHGQAGTSIAWGGWQDVGMAADHFNKTAQLIRPVAPKDALQLSEHILGTDHAYHAVLPVDWAMWQKHIAPFSDKTLLHDIAPAVPVSNAHTSLSAPVGNMQDWLCETIGKIFAIPAAELPKDEPLNMLGMDSLMAMEIKNTIEGALGASVQIIDLMGGITINELAQSLSTEEVAKKENIAPFSCQHIPLSHGQQSLWLINQIDPDTPAYNVGFALSLQGTLNEQDLYSDWQSIVARHPLLSCKIEEQGDQAYLAQSVSLFDFNTIDASLWDETRLRDEVQHAYQKPFNLKNGPLFRVSHFRKSSADHILLITAHHIACDGWSLWHLLDEFAQLKSGNPLQENPCSYTQYVNRQADFLEGSQGDKQWKFWEDRLNGPLPVLALPTDHPRPTVQTYNGKTHTVILDRDLSSSLKANAKRMGVSDFVILLALYNVLLHRYSGQNGILIGCPTTGRNRAEYENIVGHFVNPVVLRSDLSHDIAFEAFVQQTRHMVLEALSHQEYPFSLLVEKLHPNRESATTPIFQTDFTLQQPQKAKDLIACLLSDDISKKQLHWGDLTLSPYEINQQEGQFDISFEVIESDGVFHCSLKYNTDLFASNTIQRMASHFTLLAQSATDEPQLPLSQINMLAEEERQRLLVDFNNTDATYPLDQPIQSIFERQAERTPDKIAVIDANQRLTYRELNEKANQIAHALCHIGIKANDFVGILDHRSADFLASILGILKAGAAYIPIDPDYPQERIAYMVENSQCPVVITRESCCEKLPDSQYLKHRLLLDKTHDLESFDTTNPTIQNTVQDRAYMIYTSGSTGQPKGTIIRQNGALNHIFAEFEALSFHEDSRFLQSAPASSDISVWQFLAPVLIGGTCVIADFATVCNAEALSTLIREEEVSIIELVPIVLDELLAHLKAHPEATPHKLEWGMVTGEAASVALVNRWFDVLPQIPLVNAYGPSEAADDVCQHILREKLPATAHNVSVGKPVANMKMYVLTPDLQLCPIGIVGEICVSGIGVGEGYWQNPEKTAAHFVPNPYGNNDHHTTLYKTGDMGRWLEDGTLECIGRSDDQVKIRGYRVELGEIEAALMSHDVIRQALVVPVDQPPYGTRLVAYLRSEATHLPEQSELRRFLEEKLPPHMVPSAFVKLDSFPQLPNGKVDKKALPQADFTPQNTSPNTQSLNATQSKLIALWQDVLQVDHVGPHDNFFDLGGHSLLLARLHRRVQQEFSRTFALVVMFQYPTVASLAGYMNPTDSKPISSNVSPQRQTRSNDIAIIAMTCRFPGAKNVDEYWQNLLNKTESVTFFSDEDLKKRGVAAHLRDHPDYVAGCAALEGLDQFDADLFGFNAREAQLMDPQHRLFLECAWETLESAGYHGQNGTKNLIGCFAGQGATAYLSHHVQPSLAAEESAELYQVEISNDKDYLATITGYKLNLQGPCVSVQTACSTSLVAIHMACKSLLEGECDMALAGSISANVQHQSGYLYQDGMILSPDGHCRPFDEQAQGTIPGSGCGIVMLKPLNAAQADGDTIHGIIKGSALNNDGSLKAGYTAPSVEGQINVIEKAIATANVSPASISYIGAHGTGTPMGDPIELAALQTVYGSSTTSRNQPCTITSVKANIGHTDTAAGVASLIAAIMAMKHEKVAPQLHFNRLNPAIELDHNAFIIPDQPMEWKRGDTPRRAAVSSLGIGGTNAHIILEEGPSVPVTNSTNESPVLLPLSAQTSTALDTTCQRLANHLERSPDFALSDVAYTLGMGRRHLGKRRAIACETREEAIKQLRTPSTTAKTDNIVFMFSGQGAQFCHMGKDLYAHEKVFRQTLDDVLNLFDKQLDTNLHAILFPPQGSKDTTRINNTAFTQPLLFAFEYATAKLLESYNVHPQAMIGHSIGEYVAACLSGVFSLKDAVLLVSERARLMQSMPTGAMCALHLPVEKVAPYLEARLDIAAINSSALCVISGAHDAVDTLEDRLKADNVSYRRLHTSHAFHSSAMEPLKEDFLKAFDQIDLKAPSIPFISNLSGDWITPEQACDPRYWYDHLRHTVRFADGLEKLLERDDNGLFVEVGPGNALSTFTQQHKAKTRSHQVLPCHTGVYDKQDGTKQFLSTLGKVWCAGTDINWQNLWQSQTAKRIALPTYPFEHKRYWIDPPKQDRKHSKQDTRKRKDVGDWFYVPFWVRRPLGGERHNLSLSPCLIVANQHGFAQQVAERLQARDVECVVINANQSDEIAYQELFLNLTNQGKLPRSILHFGNYAPAVNDWQENLDATLSFGFDNLLNLVKALGKHTKGETVLVKAVLSNAQDVSGQDVINPLCASVPALLKVISQEYPSFICQSIDMDSPNPGHVIAELDHIAPDSIVAYRKRFRWVQTFEKTYLKKASTPVTNLRKKGVYMITGGLGYLGFLFSKHLAQKVQARLVLISRSPLPERANWQDWLDQHGPKHPINQRIMKVQELEEMGAEVLLLSLDITDKNAMKQAIGQILAQFGALNGVIHCAGVTDQDYPIEDMTSEICQSHFAPKVKGTIALNDALNGVETDFVYLFSSLASILGGLRYSAYSAVNAVMDSFTSLRNRDATTLWHSLNWDGWNGENDTAPHQHAIEGKTIGVEEGLDVFERILDACPPSDQVVISISDLESRIDKWITPRLPEAETETKNIHARPELTTAYCEPEGEREQTIAAIWQNLLGLKEIGRHDNFFELGGHSLLGTQLISRLRQNFACEINIAVLFDHPTIAGLAHHIDTQQQEKSVKANDQDAEREEFVL